MNFSPHERRALYRVLAEDTDDVFLKTDRDGFVVDASPGIGRLGFAVPDMLVGPHLLDLVDPAFRDGVRAAHATAMTGRGRNGWISFRASAGRSWYEMRLDGLGNRRGQIYGALGVIRCIDDRREFEQRLFAAEMTDPLTRLTNRRAFVAMLDHLVEARDPGCLALFSVDHLKAINMKYGQATGDEVLVVFADLLRAMMRHDDIISRIGGDCLAVLLPGATPRDAECICRNVVETLSDVSRAGGNGMHITASAGLARIGRSLDSTMKRAELALFHARATGRNRLATEQLPSSWRADAA